MDPSEVELTSSLNAVMDGTATPWQEFTMTLVFAIGGQWAAQRDGEQLDTSSLRQKAFSLIGVVLRTEPAWVSPPPSERADGSAAQKHSSCWPSWACSTGPTPTSRTPHHSPPTLCARSTSIAIPQGLCLRASGIGGGPSSGPNTDSISGVSAPSPELLN